MIPRFYICLSTIVPIRREPRESAEMVSQLLFGDYGKLLESEGGFVYIQNKIDSYDGWVDSKMILPISEEEYTELSSQPMRRVNVPIAEGFDMSDKSIMRFPGGAMLPNYDKDGAFSFREQFKYKINPYFVCDSTPKTIENIVSKATCYLHSPYLWGGKNAMGIDCSGFVQTVFSINGYFLPRDASQQIMCGSEIKSLLDAQTGDLAFFEKNGKITHVGILLSSEKIIHASGEVKIEKIDEKGIISNSTKKYTHQLVALRRIA